PPGRPSGRVPAVPPSPSHPRSIGRLLLELTPARGKTGRPETPRPRVSTSEAAKPDGGSPDADIADPDAGLDAGSGRTWFVHGRPRPVRGHHRVAADPRQLARLHRHAGVDGKRLHAELRCPACHCRDARRPVGTTPRLRGRT